MRTPPFSGLGEGDRNKEGRVIPGEDEGRDYNWDTK